MHPAEMPTLTEPPPTERARRTPRPRRAEESEASPVVHNDGELVLGAGVTLGIVPEPVKLLTKPGAVLELGDQAHVDGGTTIAAFGRVRVGAGARIGARCLVLDDQTAAGIDIGDGACIEDEVTILAGATVAAGERVARGSVVRPRPPAAARPVRDAAPAAPTLDDVRAVVSAVLPASADAPADVDLRATAGWTSLAEVQLVVALEERFGVVLADGALARRRTLAEIAALVTRPAASAAIPSPEVAATGGQTKRSSRADRLAAEARALGAAFGWHRLCARMANLVPVWALGRVRGALLRAAGCRIAPTATFLGEVSIVGPAGAAALLEVGEGSIVAPRVTFGLDAPIVLGRNVSVSPGATLYTGTHAVGRRGRRMDPHVVAKPVVVEDGAWIGLNAVLLPGVRIGAGAIVSAGSVVTADVPPDTLVAGNPAVAERTLPR